MTTDSRHDWRHHGRPYLAANRPLYFKKFKIVLGVLSFISTYLLPVLGHLKLTFIVYGLVLRPPITIIDKIATTHWRATLYFLGRNAGELGTELPLISVHSHQINAHGDTLTSATMESVSAWTKLYSSVADNSRDLSEIVSDILVHNAAEGGGRRKARGKKRSESATAETLKNRRAGLEIIHFYGNWEIKSSMCLHRK